MAQMDEQIARLGKDKKGMDEAHKKTMEDLAREEEKCNHLNKLKQKLESTLDEVRKICLWLAHVGIEKTYEEQEKSSDIKQQPPFDDRNKSNIKNYLPSF